MTLSLIDDPRVVEGRPGEPFMSNIDDAVRIVEACASHRALGALLYAANLPDGFFDLSSGIAGGVLQKLRNYRVRVAVVCPPGTITFSRRFEQMMVEERKGREFGVFETRDAALQWLTTREFKANVERDGRTIYPE